MATILEFAPTRNRQYLKNVLKRVLKPMYWLGKPPKKCDLNGEPITEVFVDGRTDLGRWGFMCPNCHANHGYGLGPGRGQKYRLQDDGKWLKTEG